MDTLKDKKYKDFNYVSRYTGVPYYYDTLCDRDVMGLSHNMKKNSAYVSHTVKAGDTLDSLALKYYNNPTYWWIIAYFNDIQDALVELSEIYKTIQIPNITSISFGDSR